MSKKDIVIVDYGLGNLFSIQRAIERVGGKSLISYNPEQIRSAEKLILPGVGAFEDGMRGLYEKGLVSTICEFANSGKPVLGICLGMQLLLSFSEEHGLHRGLDLIKGKVVRFKEPIPGGEQYKVPQIGWNSIVLPETLHQWKISGEAGRINCWENSILKDLGNKPFMYFLHSYIVSVDNSEQCLAITRYGLDEYCSVLRRDNIVGCQFHPELSGESGLAILRNFVL